MSEYGMEEILMHSQLVSPLVRESDMNEEVQSEAVEVAVTACEKFATSNERAAKMIKDAMDKKYGPSWHVVVGESFGFEISFECSFLLYMFFGTNLAILIWKCS